MNTQLTDRQIKQRIVESKIKSAKIGLAKWQQQFNDNPFDAFRWSENAMEEAATLSILQLVAKLLNDDDRTIVQIISRLKNDAMRSARTGKRGVMGDCEGYAVAARLRILESVFGIDEF